MAAIFEIRPINIKDVHGVQRVAQLTWQHTYGTIYRYEFINSFLQQAYVIKNLEASVSRDETKEIRRFLVAELNLEIVAYAQLTETTDGEVELLRIYTRRNSRRTSRKTE